jgi:HEAT repeat protein
MVVFAFDRDWTVDVNPHPRKEAVPLDWVRHLAHETDHPVYAIGNQALADEAAIPGVVDIVGRHPDDWSDWLGDKRPNGYYEQFPQRRQRLALIEDLHPNAEDYIVVDDLDLSDVTGWQHYHAWEFVPAVRNGDVDPGLPWCEPRTDGSGLPASAAIMPADIDALRSFLDEHADADAFQIEYTDNGEQRTRVAADARVIERTVKRPAAAITIKCVGLPPGTGAFRVRFDDIRSVNAVEPPDDLFAVDGDTPATRASDLADLAAVAPGRVNLPMVVDLLGSSDSAAREAAIDAAGHLANARPEDSLALLPAIHSRLTDDEYTTTVLDCIATLAAAEPSEVAPYVDNVTPYLQADDDQRRRSAARILSEIATQDPSDVVDAVPSLSTVVADYGPGFVHAVFALNQVAGDHPSEVRPAARDLTAVLADTALDAEPRLNASAALGKVASEFPDAAVDAIQSLVELLDADNQRLRANAAGVLSDIATGYAGALVPHVEDLASLLDSDDDYVLVNTTAALSRVAKTNPDTVEPYTDQYIALLDHDHRLVRLNACWALGHVGASNATDKLNDVRKTDSDEAVRTRANWALSEATDGK